MKTSRRNFIKATAAAVGAMSLPLPLTSSFGAENVELKIGFLPITDAAPLLIAHANGFFEEEGIKVREPIKVRSWSTLTESFLTGKFNLTHMLLPIPVWMRYNNKFPVKVLAWDHTNGSALTVHGNSGIRGFSDLDGKQIAVPYWYSMHNIILQMGLKKVGLTPVIQPQYRPLKPGQVNLFILPPSEMPAALSGKKIDGFIVAEPYNALAEIKIRARIMRFTGDIWKNHPCCVLVMHENHIREQPVFIQKAINAVVRAQLWITHNPEKTAWILSRQGRKYLPVSEKILLRVFKGYDQKTYGKGVAPQAIQHPEWGSSRIGFQPYPYSSATRFITNEMKHTLMEGKTAFLKKLDVDFVAKDLVDDSFVKNAINNIGGPEKFSAIDITHPWDREEIIEI